MSGSGGVKRVVVLGDVMLDRYVVGNAGRISPEAPVPVVRVDQERAVLGGAGNVAGCLRALGLEVELHAALGADAPAQTVRELLRERGIVADAVVEDTGRPTTTKTRVMAAGQQIVRVDREDSRSLSAELESRIADNVIRALPSASVLVISDYLKGVVTESLARKVIDRARERGLPVLCDPKGLDFSKYRGVTLLTPNRLEAEAALRVSLGDEAAVRRAGLDLVTRLELEHAVITLGARGMAIVSGEQEYVLIPTRAREVFDVSGAGDAVLAGLTYALATGQDVQAAAEFANAAAGVVVGKLGTATATQEEIRSLLESSHEPARGLAESSAVVTRVELAARLETWRREGRRVVFTNGCFDLLHAGHVQYLSQAASEGDVLVLGLNSDASVSRLKGPSRPINGEADRASVVAALQSVDAVCIFEEDTPLSLIELVLPDVLVKGGDYSAEQVVGADLVQSRGGRLVLAPLVAGKSTTSMLSRGAPPKSD